MGFKEIPDRYLGTIIHYITTFHNDTSEFNRPHIRTSFETSYIFFIFLYGLLMVTGIVFNILMLGKIILRRRYCLIVHKYLACNAINDTLKCLIVLPMALCTTLIQNWIYGGFMCELFPMLQDVPFHATMLTFLLIEFDRYRQILYPIKQKLSFCFCIICVWVSSVIAVLPYTVYTRYLDLQLYLGDQFKNTGICSINIEDNIKEYIRGLFIIMYVMPLALIAFLHVKVTEEIKTKISMALETNRKRMNSLTSNNPSEVGRDGGKRFSTVMLSVSSEFVSRPSSSRSCHDSSFPFATTIDNREDYKDWLREQQVQDFMWLVITIYAVCLLPLNIVRLLKHVVYETSENSYHFDFTFIIVVLLAFIPSLTTPLIYRYYHFENTGSGQASNQYKRLGRSSDVSLSVYEPIKRESQSKKTETGESGKVCTSSH